MRARSRAPPDAERRERADAIARGAARGDRVRRRLPEPVAEPVARLAAALRLAGAGRPASGRALRPARPLARGGALRRAAARPTASPARTRPDLVLRVGDTPTSKPLRAWLAGRRQVVIDPHARLARAHARGRAIVLAAGPRRCSTRSPRRPRRPTRDPGWLGSWRRRRRARARRRWRERAGAASSRKVAAALEPALPDDALRVGRAPRCRSATSRPSSRLEPSALRFLANRGRQRHRRRGLVGRGRRAGDRRGRASCSPASWRCSTTSAACSRRAAPGAELTIVCVNNGGGGIFDFLPVAEHAERERLRAPHRHAARRRLRAGGRAGAGSSTAWRAAPTSVAAAVAGAGAGGGPHRPGRQRAPPPRGGRRAWRQRL